MNILCKFGHHDWQVTTRGQSFQGSVYPIRFRTCTRCKMTEHELYDEDNQTSSWTKLAPNSELDKAEKG